MIKRIVSIVVTVSILLTMSLVTNVITLAEPLTPVSFDPAALRTHALTTMNGSLAKIPYTAASPWVPQLSYNGENYRNAPEVKGIEWGGGVSNPDMVLFLDSNLSANGYIGFQGLGGLQPVNTSVDTNGAKMALAFIVPKTGSYTIKPNENFTDIKLPNSYVAGGYYKGNESVVQKFLISKNGQKIWPANSAALELSSLNPSAAFPSIENISLVAGDIIRFENINDNNLGWINCMFYYPIIEDVTGQPPVNHAPTASTKTISAQAGIQLSGEVTASDLDNDPLQFIVVDNASHGSLNLQTNGSFTYTPAVGYDGQDTFTFKVNDGKIDSAVATVIINITIPGSVVFDPSQLRLQSIAALGEKVDVTIPYTGVNPWLAQVALVNEDYRNFTKVTAMKWSSDRTAANPDFVMYMDGTGTTPNIGFQSDGKTAPIDPLILSPQAKNSKVALAFVAPASGTYKIRAKSDAYNKVRIHENYINNGYYAGKEDQPVGFKITVNGQKIWPTSGEFASLTANNPSITMPTINDLNLIADDIVRFECIAGDVMTWENLLFLYPVIEQTAISTVNEAPKTQDVHTFVESGKSVTQKFISKDNNGDALTYQLVTNPGSGTCQINNSTGEFTYNAPDNFVGQVKFTYKANDGKLDSNVSNITILVGKKYDAIEYLTGKINEVRNGKENAFVSVDMSNWIWQWQYTYSGIAADVNGADKYEPAGQTKYINDNGWIGYVLTSNATPNLCIQQLDGTLVAGLNAGDLPANKNPIGALTFVAPQDSTYILKPQDAFNKIKMFQSSITNNLEPIKIWITKDGTKVWPANADSVSLTAETTYVDFPTITLAMKEGSQLRIHTQGNISNQWYNDIAIAPVVMSIGDYDADLDPSNNENLNYLPLVIDMGTIEAVLTLNDEFTYAETDKDILIKGDVVELMAAGDKDIKLQFTGGYILIPDALANEIFKGTQDMKIRFIPSESNTLGEFINGQNLMAEGQTYRLQFIYGETVVEKLPGNITIALTTSIVNPNKLKAANLTDEKTKLCTVGAIREGYASFVTGTLGYYQLASDPDIDDVSPATGDTLLPLVMFALLSLASVSVFLSRKRVRQ
jgi:VCBS repeat-containing protein